MGGFAGESIVIALQYLCYWEVISMLLGGNSIDIADARFWGNGEKNGGRMGENRGERRRKERGERGENGGKGGKLGIRVEIWGGM